MKLAEIKIPITGNTFIVAIAGTLRVKNFQKARSCRLKKGNSYTNLKKEIPIPIELTEILQVLPSLDNPVLEGDI